MSVNKLKLTDILSVSLFSGFIVFVLIVGWQQKGEYWISAEKGLGYVFGIIGASMMALLLLYPLRKNVRMLKNLFPIRYWFKGHMLLGILGPTFILFHSNFSLGSTNSSVALACMLLVVASGIVGRFIYRKIHNGLYGKALDFQSLHKQYLTLRTSQNIPIQVVEKLEDLESLLADQHNSIRHSFRSTMNARRYSKQIERVYKKIFKDRDSAEAKMLIDLINEQTSLLKQMSGLSFYNRLFSLWHVAHLPFFFMMVFTSAIHIVIVHMY